MLWIVDNIQWLNQERVRGQELMEVLPTVISEFPAAIGYGENMIERYEELRDSEFILIKLEYYYHLISAYLLVENNRKMAVVIKELEKFYRENKNLLDTFRDLHKKEINVNRAREGMVAI